MTIDNIKVRVVTTYEARTAGQEAGIKKLRQETKGLADDVTKVHSKFDALKDVAGAVAGGLGIGLTVGALATQAVSAIGDEIAAWRAKQEEIRNATNVLVKYYDSADQAERALGAQRDLATDLHVSLGDAVNAYDAVRQATDGLYLSSAQQVNITKTLGQVMEMNNRPIGDAASIMQKLQYAMQTGSLGAGEFKQIAKDFPDVMATWTAATGKSYRQLLYLAEGGRLGAAEIRQFTTSLEHSGEVQAQWEKRAKSFDEVLADQNKEMREMVDVTTRTNKATAETIDFYQRLTNGIRMQMDELKAYRTGLDDTGSAIAAFNGALLRIGTTINDPWGGGASQFEKTMKSAISLTAPVADAKAQLRSLDDAWKTTVEHTGRNAIEYRKSRKALTDTIAGEVSIDYYKQVLDGIKQPEKDWNGRLTALNALHKSNRISVQEYDDALQGLIKTYSGADFVGMIDAANGKYGKRDNESKAFARHQGEEGRAAQDADELDAIDASKAKERSDRLQGRIDQVAKYQALTDSWRARLQGQPSITEQMFGTVSEINGYQEAWGALTGAATAGYDAMVDGTSSVGDAIRRSVADSLKAMGAKFLVRGLEEVAEGFGALASYQYPSAALHFKAAAGFGLAAVAAGATANAIGTSASAGAGGARPSAPQTGGSGAANSNQGRSVTIVYGDDYADDSARKRQLTAKKLVARALAQGAGSSSAQDG